jgi:UDP-GlcNAc:undecaprenyl-phosphate GlcNAc-1-phosphate transferase
MSNKFYLIYAYFLIFSFTISVIGVLFFRWLARRIGFIDLPGNRKIHREPTPLLGGAAIFGAVYLTVIANYMIFHFLIARGSFTWLLPEIVFSGYSLLGPKWIKVLIFFLGGLLIFIYGLIDDKKNISPINRLVVEAIVAVLVVSLGIRPGITDSVHILGIIIAIGWIVGITNGFNLLDGLNGLCSGIGLIASIIFFLVSFNSNQILVCILLVVFIGAIAGFFIFNFPKGKIFLGSAGSMFIGYTLSVLVLFQSFGANFSTGNPLPLAMPVLILSLPLIDTLTVMYLRFRQHRPLFAADHNHIHHRLRRLRMSDFESTVVLFLLTFCVGINATLLYKSTLVESVIVLIQAGAIYAAFAFLIHVRERRSNRRTNAFGIMYAEKNCDAGKKIWEGFILNISKEGISFCLTNIEESYMHTSYFSGQDLQLKLLPSGQSYHGATPFLQLSGKVVWEQKVAVNSVHIGFVFLNLLIDERQLIENMFYNKEVRAETSEKLI